MSTPRILFVDDEPRVLDGVRDLLRKHRKRWDMHFCVGGDLALETLEKESFDVVVTDLRMPRVDGVAVLRWLHERRPDTVRLVLSGDPGEASALRVVPHAHQYLSKPARPGELEAVLDRACRHRERIADERVRAVIGRLHELPALPRTYQKLVAMLEDERVGMRDIAEVVAKDIGVSAKLLQLVNSSFFGVGRTVANVGEAITILGIEVVKNLVLSLGVFGAAKLSREVGVFAEALHGHSLVIAEVAVALAGDGERKDAYTAGLLHDAGWMVLALEMPQMVGLGQGRAKPGRPSRELEGFALHAPIGAYLLGIWGLPLAVIDAVARHDEPLDETFGPVARAVCTAERILEELEADPAAKDPGELRRMALERAAAVRAGQVAA